MLVAWMRHWLNSGIATRRRPARRRLHVCSLEDRVVLNGTPVLDPAFGSAGQVLASCQTPAPVPCQLGDLVRKADTAVTADDIANCNLVLVGTPSTNALLAQIAPNLPVSWQANGIQVGSHLYPNTTAGPVALTMIYPNPLNPARYVLILPDHYSGGTPLTYGDYAIHRLVSTTPGPRMSLVATGYFSSHWQAT